MLKTTNQIYRFWTFGDVSFPDYGLPEGSSKILGVICEALQHAAAELKAPVMRMGPDNFWFHHPDIKHPLNILNGPGL